MMQSLDRRLATEFAEKLARIPEDQKPLWGKMNRAQLYGHLEMVLRYTMGEGQPLPYRGKWIYRHVFRHLVVNGILEFPHNVRLPRPKGEKEPVPPVATLEDLKQTLNAYVSAAEGGTLPARQHPFFGELSGRAWQKFHVGHFKHHLKQFGVWDAPIGG